MRAIDFTEKKTAEFVRQHDRGYYDCGENRRYSEDKLEGSGEYLCFQRGTPACAGKGFFLAESEPSSEQHGEITVRWIKL